MIVILLEYNLRNCGVKICLYFKHLLGLKTELLTGLPNAKFAETQIVYMRVWFEVLSSVSTFLCLMAILMFWVFFFDTSA